jgi:hypothetical protein
VTGVPYTYALPICGSERDQFHRILAKLDRQIDVLTREPEKET